MVVVGIGQGGVLGGETEGQVHIRQASVALVLYRRQVETLAGTRPEGCQPVLVQVQDRPRRLDGGSGVRLLFDGTVVRFAKSRIAPAATKKARAVLEMQSAISLTVFDRDFVEVVEVFEQILCWGGGHLGLNRGDTQGDERDALAARGPR